MTAPTLNPLGIHVKLPLPMGSFPLSLVQIPGENLIG